MSRLMLAAMQSGSGKTVLACGLMAALQARGLQVRAFKCGPDYIDPMFHSRVLGVPGRNLDLFLQGERGVQKTLAAHEGEVAVLEGAMGFYDGLGDTKAASAWHVAHATQTPVVCIVRAKGASLTLAAQIRGMTGFCAESRIAGLLLNECSAVQAARLAPMLQRETGLAVLGYLPQMPQAALESRHLGLLTAGEVERFSERFAQIAAQMEQTVDIDALLRLARTAPALGEDGAAPLCKGAGQRGAAPPRCRIAVARDEAFCFYYQDNLEQLQREGAELCFFSPLRDAALPPHTDGVYLGGGYPELHAQTLSANSALREALCTALRRGTPTVAECGGFLYLQQSLQDEAGMPHRMVGVLSGEGIKTQRLQRFGYLTLTAKQDSLLLRAGECMPAHAFHYWDCTQNGDSFTAQKPMQNKTWECGVATPQLYAAFAHVHFGGALPLARRFVEAAEKRRQDGQTEHSDKKHSADE